MKKFKFILYFCLIIIFANFVFASGNYILPSPQAISPSNTLYAITPSGTLITLDECIDDEQCLYNYNPETTQCDEEGQWGIRFTVGHEQSEIYVIFDEQYTDTENSSELISNISRISSWDAPEIFQGDSWVVNYETKQDQCLSTACHGGLQNDWRVAHPNSCCGDDRDIGGDCAKILNNNICDVTPEGGTIFPNNPGNVKTISCAFAQFLATGSEWKFCELGGVAGNADVTWKARSPAVLNLAARLPGTPLISAAEYSSYQSTPVFTTDANQKTVFTGMGISVNSPYIINELAIEARPLVDCELSSTPLQEPASGNLNNLQKFVLAPNNYVITGIGINFTFSEVKRRETTNYNVPFDKIDIQKRRTSCKLGPAILLGSNKTNITRVYNDGDAESNVITGLGVISYSGAFVEPGNLIFRTNTLDNIMIKNTINMDITTPIGSEIDQAELIVPGTYSLSTNSPIVGVSFNSSNEVLDTTIQVPSTIPIYLNKISPVSGDNGDFTLLEINNHGYVCSGIGIVECCGIDINDCQDTDETPMTSTEPPVAVGDLLYYCLENGLFDANLDSRENECNTAGLTWTGSKCCSESDDDNEYYNEPLDSIDEYNFGSCWNKEFVRSGYMPSINGSNLETVINYNGSFYGCEADIGDLAILDYHTGSQLIASMPTCAILPNAQTSLAAHLSCSPEGKWINVNSISSNSLKEIAWDDPDLDQTSCCEISQCWDGTECIDNMADLSSIKPINGLRCVDGNWKTALSKKTWDGSESGFCAENVDCLVDVGGDGSFNYQPSKYFSLSNANPACITNDQHILDFACEEGNWTTRTKQIGETLLNFLQVSNKETDFVFVCGHYSETLNEFDSVKNLLEGCTVGDTKEDCVNNFCVLQYGQDTAVGVSLNTALDSDSSFLQVLDKGGNFCKPYTTDGKFHKCGSTDNIWFNNLTNSLIYLTSNHDLYPATGLDLFKQFIKNPFTTVRDFVFAKLNENPSSWLFFDDTRIFNKLFAANKDGKELFAFLEENQALKPLPGTEFRDYLGIKYTGVGVDICEFINRYDNKASCDKSGDVYQIVSSRIGEDSALADAWTDLTSKLRP